MNLIQRVTGANEMNCVRLTDNRLLRNDNDKERS